MFCQEELRASPYFPEFLAGAPDSLLGPKHTHVSCVMNKDSGCPLLVSHLSGSLVASNFNVVGENSELKLSVSSGAQLRPRFTILYTHPGGESC